MGNCSTQGVMVRERDTESVSSEGGFTYCGNDARKEAVRLIVSAVAEAPTQVLEPIRGRARI